MGSVIKRIALSTVAATRRGPNAVIRAATLTARNRGWEVVGIRDGFNGLLLPERYPDGGVIEITRDRVRGIVYRGGTILGTTNRGNPIACPMPQRDGAWTKATNLGDKINSSGSEYSPLVTPDGKYFFWSSTRSVPTTSQTKRLTYTDLLNKLRSPGNGLGDIYQIDISALNIQP